MLPRTTSRVRKRPEPSAKIAPPAIVVPPGWVLVPDHCTEEWALALRARTSYPSIGQAVRMMLDTAPKYEEKI